MCEPIKQRSFGRDETRNRNGCEREERLLNVKR
jgi:hypothetical protein